MCVDSETEIERKRKETDVASGVGVDERKREREREIKLYFSTVKILAQRPTHISAVATVLLIINLHS